MNAQLMHAMLASAQSREALARLYVEWVGYDPFADDANITETEVRETLSELIVEMTATTV